ncbi:hypothetical protein MRB53_027414 [Persea americana]|uniref:Uncharacterized protein n=1 Tax=Persea americana TaxID=3435 RepID=A0ACC2LLP3_PERAE|nr:hypothetical protein MRB53_027414 [Persea americana]
MREQCEVWLRTRSEFGSVQLGRLIGGSASLCSFLLVGVLVSSKCLGGVSDGTQQCETKKTGTSLSLHWLITDESPIALHVSSPAIGGQRTAPDQPIIERVPRNGSCIRPSRHEQKAVSWRKRKATETQQPQTTSVSESRPIPLQGPVCNIIPTLPSYPRPFLCLYCLVPFICH